MGIIGLGIMGRNLLLNMADKGFIVAGYDKDLSKVSSLCIEARDHTIHATADIKEFIDLLKTPRAILFLVPAGQIVDSVIEDLLPYLKSGDLLIDAGNSYFKDTEIRMDYLQSKEIRYLGLGVSGGEEGARHGPSLMPGGPKEAYLQIQPILEAIAAKVNRESCVTYLGPRSVGHFVKMVHNGIEYGIMQLIAESYDILKRGIGLNNDQLRDVYKRWNSGELNSYLIEITSQIFDYIDDKQEDHKFKQRLIDNILPVAKQNGTGMWTAQSAMELQVPTPTIDVAVTMRDLSVFKQERTEMSNIYSLSSSLSASSKISDPNNQDIFIKNLEQALLTGIIVVYTQGFSLLKVASLQYHYNLNLENVARIWRGGCIIRAVLLEDICLAFQKQPALSNLLLDQKLSTLIKKSISHLREIVYKSTKEEIPIPGLMSVLGYLDAYRSAWLPFNLIQAQRDYFGAHGYERINTKGQFHTEWEKK